VTGRCRSRKSSLTSIVFLYHCAPLSRGRQPPTRRERKGPMTVASGTVLTDSLLEACRRRAAGYDRDNRFCQEDFDELKAAGYLRMAVPREFGGFGFTLAEVAGGRRRLAGDAPATAPCINKHKHRAGTA